MMLRTSRLDRIGYLLGHVADASHRQTDQALTEQLGIGLSQLRLMTMLQHYPGIPQRTLADHLGQTEASISRQIKLLADKAIVVIATDPAEKRKRLITLTPKGAKLAEAAKERIDVMRNKLYSALDEKQQDTLIEALDRLHEQTCQPGKLKACDRPFDLLDAYSIQATT